MRRTPITTTQRQKRIFWAILFVIMSLFATYGYFVSKSITNVLLREEIEQQIVQAHSDIGELEFVYLERKNMVNLSYAYNAGFVDISDKEFVARKSVLGSRVTLNDDSL